MLTLRDLAPFKRWIAVYYAIYVLCLIGIITDLFSVEVRWILTTFMLLFALTTQWMAIKRRRQQQENIRIVENLARSIR